MLISARWWLVPCAALLLAGPLGCVTKGKYNDLAAERDELRTGQETLTQQVETLEASRAELSDKLATSEVEVARMRGTYDQLVSELESEVASGKVVIKKMVDGIRLNVSDELLFPSGSATLQSAGNDLLSRVAARIKNEKAIISVEGHTDTVAISPSLRRVYATNWELAGARAARVVRLLSEQGVDPTMLRAVSRGPFAPLVSNDTREGRAKNRRTEIILRPIPR